MDESFEATRQFHKDLEEFFNAMVVPPLTIYYERRSKQYQHDPRIKQTQRINLRSLTQYIVGMFLNKPHDSHRHESKLLRDYQDKIYIDQQSKLTYFTASLAFLRLEELIRRGKISRSDFYSYRAHLLMVLRQIVGGDAPNINLEKKIDAHCQLVLNVLADDDKLIEKVLDALRIFLECRQQWTTEMGRSIYGMKDVPEFTELLLKRASKYLEDHSGAIPDSPKGSADVEHAQAPDSGHVVKISRDRFDQAYGFIGRRSGDIFFHASDSPDLSFIALKGVFVAFEVVHGNRGRQAVNVRRVE